MASPSVVTVSSTAALKSAIATASGDTIIKLTAGTYANVLLTGINPVGHITVQSADPAHLATIDILHVSNSSNLSFETLNFRHVLGVNDLTATFQIIVSGSHAIGFAGIDVASRINTINTDDVSGLEITGSDHVTVLDSHFHDLRTSLYAIHSDHLILAQNRVDKVREGMDFADVHQVSIDRNAFTNFKPVLTGTSPDHPDAIQFWTSGTVASSDVQITNNSFLFGQHLPIQGVFIRSETGPTQRHSNITVDNNVYVGQSRHGITVSDTDGATISGNTVVSAAKSGVAVYLDPAINVNNVTGAKVTDNIASLFNFVGDSGLFTQNNVDAYDYQTGKGLSMAALFGNTPGATSTAASLLAKPVATGAGFTGATEIGGVGTDAAHSLAHYGPLIDLAGHLPLI